jgi:hypothetical protein
MNSGDCFISENTLANVFSKEHTADLLVGNIIMDWTRYQERRSCPSKITFYFFYTGDTLRHQATFTKRILFDDIGLYDEQYKICSDWKFALLAIIKYNKSLEKLEEDIALIDTTGISITNKFAPCLKNERADILKEYFPFFYEDCNELYRLKRFTVHRMKLYIKWRLRRLLCGR